MRELNSNEKRSLELIAIADETAGKLLENTILVAEEYGLKRNDVLPIWDTYSKMYFSSQGTPQKKDLLLPENASRYAAHIIKKNDYCAQRTIEFIKIAYQHNNS